MRNLIIASLLGLLAQPGLAQTEIDERAPMNNGALLEVINASGIITVTGWRQQEIEVTGTLGEDAERLIFEPDRDRVLVRVEYDKNKRHERYPKTSTSLMIRVPHSAHLEIESVSADIGISEVRGDQRLRSVSGGIETRLEGEEASLRTVSGDIAATGNGRAKRVALYTVSGTIDASGLSGEMRAEAVSGDIEVAGTGLSEVFLKSVSGDIEGRLGLTAEARVESEAISGDIELTIPADYPAEYELSSLSGDIAELHGNKAQRKSKYAPGRYLRFTHKDGRSRIRANTLSGDIEIETLTEE